MKFLQVLPFFLIVFLAACGDSGTFGDGDTSDDPPVPTGTPDREAVDGPWTNTDNAGCTIDFSSGDAVEILSNGEVVEATFEVIPNVNGFDMLTFSNVSTEPGMDCQDANLTMASLTDGPFSVDLAENTMSWFLSPDDDQPEFSFDYIPFPEDFEEDGSTADLVEINPDSGIAGAATMFTVTLNYSVNVDSTLSVGLNEIFRDSLAEPTELELLAGDAEEGAEFPLDGTVFDWGNDADFAVLVQITNTEGVVLSSYAFPIGITAP